MIRFSQLGDLSPKHLQILGLVLTHPAVMRLAGMQCYSAIKAVMFQGLWLWVSLIDGKILSDFMETL